MALQPRPSRFAVLPDDVDEPVAKSNKGGGGDKGKKKAASSKGSVDKKKDASKKKPQGKSLKSLAFGGSSDGKKKQGNNPNPQSQTLPGSVPVVNGQNSNTNGIGLQNGRRRSEQWEDWQKRDSEIVEGVYESELEAALVQSKLDFESQLNHKGSKAAGSKSKAKKKVTVPLNEFTPDLLEHKPTDADSHETEDNEALVERYRMEAKHQIERQKDIEQQREILAQRDKEGVYRHPHYKQRMSGNNEQQEGDQKSVIVALQAENEFLKGELESYKMRLKKVHDIFQGAQELKDKAKLIFEVDSLTKMQQDLQQEVQLLHSQLEQERSKAHLAMSEVRRLVEQQSRRRGNSNTESN